MASLPVPVTPAQVALALTILYSSALRVTVLLAAAYLALRLLRGASAATRAAACTTALAALAAVQLLRVVPVGWEARVPGALADPMAALGSVGIAAGAAAAPARYAALGRVTEELVTTYPRVLAVLLAVWAVGVAAVLLSLARGAAAAHRIAVRSAPEHDAEWLRLLSDARAALGVRRPVRLLRDDAPRTPLTWGVRRPVIVLPAAADGWPAAHRRAVLLHELAHVGAGDALARVLARLACAALWFHPGVWWLARRHRAERELACDDRVLAAGVRASDYAECLLRLADMLRPAGAATPVAAAATGASPLKRRVAALLDPSRRRRTAPAPGVVAAAVALGALVALSLGTARLLPPRARAERWLSDPRWETRAYGVAVLATMGGPESVATLARTMRTDPSGRVRVRAGYALAVMQGAPPRAAAAARR